MKLEDLRILLRPLARRISTMLARGIVRTVDDQKPTQLLQLGLLAGEVRDRVEHVQPYGFTANPPVGAEVVAGFLGGARDHGIALVVGDRRYRLTGLASGEVALHDDLGTQIVLRRGGVVEVKASTRVEIQAPLARFTGDVELAGSLRADGDVEASGDVSDGSGSMQTIRDVYNLHTHPENGDGGGITSPPIQPMP